MTTNQRAMLTAIVNNDYHDSSDPVGVLNPGWLWSVTEEFGPSAGGIMASLVEAGWAKTSGVLPGDEGTCQITPKGLAELRKEQR